MQHSAERENFEQIIKDSHRRVVRLKLLSNFFQQIDLVSIYIRTKLIHQTFNDSKELDINKLELFHLQYSDSLIELLQKIKKSKEQQITFLTHEIQLNQEYVDRSQTVVSEENFEQERKFYSALVSATLKRLYDQLSTPEKEYSFDWSGMAAFTYKYRENYYRELTEEQTKILKEEWTSVKAYETPYVIFERKLLGKLNIQQFKVRFICGYASGTDTFELFSIFRDEDFFIYHVAEKRFFFIEEAKLDLFNTETNTRQNRVLAEELQERNMQLEAMITEVKTTLKPDQEKLLKEYLSTISSVDFMEHLQSVDAQTNILRTMLNLNINNT